MSEVFLGTAEESGTHCVIVDRLFESGGATCLPWPTCHKSQRSNGMIIQSAAQIETLLPLDGGREREPIRPRSGECRYEEMSHSGPRVGSAPSAISHSLFPRRPQAATIYPVVIPTEWIA
jgi:hypothetical protein